MALSTIEWTDYTFNPWWGCVKVSPGCEHCYAETLSKRWGNDVWGPAKTTQRRLFNGNHWIEPRKWESKAFIEGKKKVFCGSMCDVFEDHPGIESERLRLFGLIMITPNLIWQLLTKRPENIMQMVPESWRTGFPENVWIGTSVEDQQRAVERIHWLIDIPAKVKFLSCEPLIESVIFSVKGIDWVIVGGESGPRKRPFNSDWARIIRNECERNRVPFFMKQIDKVKEIPNDLMIREFPKLHVVDRQGDQWR